MVHLMELLTSVKDFRQLSFYRKYRIFVCVIFCVPVGAEIPIRLVYRDGGMGGGDGGDKSPSNNSPEFALIFT